MVCNVSFHPNRNEQKSKILKVLSHTHATERDAQSHRNVIHLTAILENNKYYVGYIEENPLFR